MRPLHALLGTLKGLFLLAALAIPIYIFATASPGRTDRPSSSASTVARPSTIVRDGGRWSLHRGTRDELRQAFRGDSLLLPGSNERWTAIYWAPASGGWQSYRVRVEIARLPSAGPRADASIILGRPSTARDRIAVSVSATRLTVRALHGDQRTTLASTRIVKASQHRLSLSVHHRRITITIDEKRLDVTTKPLSIAVALGIWRERPESPQPRFSHMSITPLSSPSETQGSSHRSTET